jgi:CDP-4-dehydro-6-deoxyglucose reductase, E1
MTHKIQYSGPVMGVTERAAIDRVLDRGWLGAGTEVRQFERELAAYLGVAHTVMVNSGSSANLLALASLRLPVGSEVVLSAHAFPTTVAPIVQLGLVPVFVDTELGYYNPMSWQIRDACGAKTKAIIAQHTLGNPSNLAAFEDLAYAFGATLMEDACDALGATYRNWKIGSLGKVATCSFYPAHHITTGEGGAVTCNDDAVAYRLRSLRDWGRACTCDACVVLADPNAVCSNVVAADDLPHDYDTRYAYTNIGYNMKPLELQGALGRIQLGRLPEFLSARQRNFESLYSCFSDYEEHFVLPTSLPDATPAWFAFPLTIRDNAPFDRRTVRTYLDGCGIETRPFFAGNILRHPAYKGIRHRVVGDLRNCDKVLHDSFFMGIYPGITEDDMAYIVDCIRVFMRSI